MAGKNWPIVWRQRKMKKRGRIVAFFLIVLIFGGLIGSTVTGVTKDINLGLDLQGGFEILYEVEPVDESQEVDRDLLESTVQTLNDRVNRLGISEASIDIEGENRIRVQLAGVQDQTEAREILSTSARLSFRDVNDNELLNGNDVKEGSAKQDFDQTTNAPIVTLQLKDAAKFGEVSTQIKNMGAPDNLLVIWMDYQEGDSFAAESEKEDPKYISAPSIRETLNTTNVMISGDFSVESAQRLADIINSGSLPVHMTEMYSNSVGAQFGEMALDKTVFAGFVGVALIFIFMIIVYRLPGFVAAVNLSIYIYLILVIFELMNGVLTLPGIAALILGVGMAVDANVITFERIREELRTGKSVIAAFKTGSKNSLSTIFDANITTLLAAAVLFMFGTSSVKGFATMLIVSIVVSFLTAVFGTRLLLGLWVKSKVLNKRLGWFGVKKDSVKDISSKEQPEPEFFNKKLNIVQHRKKFFAISIAMVVVGIASLLLFKLNPGIDFTSGSRVEVIAEDSITEEQVTSDFENLGLEADVVISGDNNDRGVARFDKVLSEDKVTEVTTYFEDAYGTPPNIGVVSPIVGEELVKNAL